MSNVAPEICSCSALRQAARHATKLYDDALALVAARRSAIFCAHSRSAVS